MFKVIHAFADVQDGGHIYHDGDVFPREGVKVSLERQKELLGSENRIGEPLIVEEKKSENVRESKPKKNKDK